MEITASGTITERSIMELTYISSYGKSSPKKKLFVYTFLFLLLLGIFIFKGIILGFKSSDIFSITVCIIVLFLQLYLYLWFPKIKIKSIKRLLGTTTDYIFYDNDFQTVTNTSDVSENSTVKYSYIKKVFETKAHLFLLLQNNTAFIVNKETISNDALQKKLMDAVPKYKRCNY